MKKGIFFGLLLAAVLVVPLIFTGCDKTTGGGTFTVSIFPEDIAQMFTYYDIYHPTDSLNHRCTFGFNAQPVGDLEAGGAKGQFQFIDHTAKLNIHGTFNETISGSNPLTIFGGNCTIGKEVYRFGAEFLDGKWIGYPVDAVYIVVVNSDDSIKYSYSGFLDGGNIVVHIPTPK